MKPLRSTMVFLSSLSLLAGLMVAGVAGTATAASSSGTSSATVTAPQGFAPTTRAATTKKHKSVTARFIARSSKLTSGSKKRIRSTIRSINKVSPSAKGQKLVIQARAAGSCQTARSFSRGEVSCAWRALADKRAKTLKRYVRSVGYKGRIATKLSKPKTNRNKRALSTALSTLTFAFNAPKPPIPPKPPTPPADTYDVMWNGNGGTLSGCSPTTYKKSTATITPDENSCSTITPPAGKTFNGWSPASIPTGSTGNKTFTAQWEDIEYAITWESGSGGEIADCSPITYTVSDNEITPSDESCEVVDPENGKQLTGWLPASIPTGSTGNKTFTAQWSDIEYDITWDGNGGELTNCEPEIYTLGQTITPDADSCESMTPPTGKEFAGWLPTSIESTDTGPKTFTAQWTDVVYDISWEGNGGDLDNCDPTSYTHGQTVTPDEDSCTITPPDGKEFVGWSPTSIEASDIGDKTFTAQWSNTEYNISWSSNGGTLIGCAPMTYNVDSPTITPDDNSCETIGAPNGKEFAGWLPASIPTGSTGTQTFTAQWSDIDYDITWEGNGGTVSGCSPTTYTVSSGTITPNESSCTTITPPTGKEFTGWSPASIFTGQTGDKTFTAQWTDVVYDISWDPNDGTLVNCAPTSYTYGQTVTPDENSCDTITPPDGTEFAGWLPESIEASDTGDKTFTAQWSNIDYTVGWNSNGGMLIDCSPTTYNVSSPTITPDGDSCETIGAPNGKEFAGWLPASIPTGSTGDQTFTAQWSDIDYDITWEGNGGTVSGCAPTTYTVSSAQISPDENSCSTLTPPAGKTFNGWLPENIPNGSTGDKEFTAQWVDEIYSINWESGTGGEIADCTPTTYTISDDEITPTSESCELVEPDDGMEFAGWSPESIETGSTGNQTFTAQWSEIDYGITWNANGGTLSECSPAGYTINSATITPDENSCTTITPPLGSAFAGWSPASIEAGSTGNQTFTAQWTELSCAEGGFCEVGDIGPGGGEVFYVDDREDGGFGPGNAWTYLEAAPDPLEDEYGWGCRGIVTDATGWFVGTGAANTAALVDPTNIANCVANNELSPGDPSAPGAAPHAAIAADDYENNGKADWFLPAGAEMNQLCRYIFNEPTGSEYEEIMCNGTYNGVYWTSTQGEDVSGDLSAIVQIFEFGQSGSTKDTLDSVWPIRGFTVGS